MISPFWERQKVSSLQKFLSGMVLPACGLPRWVLRLCRQ